MKAFYESRILKEITPMESFLSVAGSLNLLILPKWVLSAQKIPARFAWRDKHLVG